MLTVRFYTFSKKECSTKQPGIGDSYVEYSCLLKSGTGVISPALEIRTDTNPSVWNYCYIVDFSRYYFVQEWTYNMGEWICSLKVDVLASWKSNIESGSQYILRATDLTHRDEYVIDGYATTRTERSRGWKRFGEIFSKSDVNDDVNPHYVVAIINSESAGMTFAISYYAMTHSQVVNMKSMLLTDNGWIGNVDPGASTWEKNASKVDINPFQYIVSCKFFPTVVPVVKDSNNQPILYTHIRCGWWDANISAYKLASYCETHTSYTSVEHHPQDITDGRYLRSTGYSTYMFDWSGFHFDIPGNTMGDAVNIVYELCVDYSTGNAHCRLLANNGSVIPTKEWNLGEQTQDFAINIPITQIEFESGKGISAINQAIGNIAQLYNAPANASTGLQGGIRALGGIASALMGDRVAGTFSSQPGTLSSLVAHPQAMLSWEFVLVDSPSHYDEGVPVCQELTISTIASGFIQCRDAHLSLPATEPEMQEVINYLNGGFFYE